MVKQNKTVWVNITDITSTYSSGSTIATIPDSNFFPLGAVELLFMSSEVTQGDKGRIAISTDGRIFARDSFKTNNGKSSNGIYFTK